MVIFPVGTVVKNPLANAGDARDAGWIPGSGRSPGGGNSNPLQYPCLVNSMDGGAWWATQSRKPQELDMTEQLSIYKEKGTFCGNLNLVGRYHQIQGHEEGREQERQA